MKSEILFNHDWREHGGGTEFSRKLGLIWDLVVVIVELDGAKVLWMLLIIIQLYFTLKLGLNENKRTMWGWVIVLMLMDVMEGFIIEILLFHCPGCIQHVLFVVTKAQSVLSSSTQGSAVRQSSTVVKLFISSEKQQAFIFACNYYPVLFSIKTFC